MKVTRLERQKIEERLWFIYQLMIFFGEGEDDRDWDMDNSNVQGYDYDTDATRLLR